MQRQGKIEITHMNTTKGTGTPNNRTQRIQMYMNKTTQKLKHLQYEPPQKTGPEVTSGAPEW
jgi:hypothetical protein